MSTSFKLLAIGEIKRGLRGLDGPGRQLAWTGLDGNWDARLDTEVTNKFGINWRADVRH
jgi:hypothetical protein